MVLIVSTKSSLSKLFQSGSYRPAATLIICTCFVFCHYKRLLTVFPAIFNSIQTCKYLLSKIKHEKNKHVAFFWLRLFWYWNTTHISSWYSNQYFLFISKWINVLKNACLKILCQIFMSTCTNVAYFSIP